MWPIILFCLMFLLGAVVLATVLTLIRKYVLKKKTSEGKFVLYIGIFFILVLVLFFWFLSTLHWGC
ncbi:MAG TPA: hypothetical protein VNZ86_14135 [Bacteroidia bacterium]|jgi:hypothetical protein|nr:hypothetical protein [Bacteroidia bacterium]